MATKNYMKAKRAGADMNVSYVHSVICYKDLRATINPHYKPKISEECI